MPSTVKQIGEFSFKAVTILTAALVLVMSQGLREVAGDDDEGIPLNAHSLEGIHPRLTALMPFALILKTTSPR